MHPGRGALRRLEDLRERTLEPGDGWLHLVYGQNGPLRDWLEERHVSYVLAVPKSFPVATAAGLVRADHLAALVPAAGWQQVSCGDGSKGPGTTTGR